MGAVVGVFETY